MKYGDFVTIVTSGDYGKPRPALIIQSDVFAAIPSLTVLPLTSEIHDEYLVRLTIQPNKRNGLKAPSQIMVDKITTLPKTKIGQVIGHAETATMQYVKAALKQFLNV